MRLFKASHHEAVGPPFREYHENFNVRVQADLWTDEESGSVGRVTVEFYHSGAGCSEAESCPGCAAVPKLNRVDLVNDATREKLIRLVVLAEAIAQEQLTAAANRYRPNTAQSVLDELAPPKG